jgi:DNA polymerase III sliding clamp (beta) subunit (PCNA family)
MLTGFCRLVKADDQIQVMREGDAFSLVIADKQTYLVTREIESQFPKYAQIIPSDEPTVTVRVPVDELLDKTQLAHVVSKRTTDTVRLDMVDEQLHVHGYAEGDQGEGGIAVEYTADCAPGDRPMPVGLNGVFLRQAIQGLKVACPGAEHVNLEFRREGAPILLRPDTAAYTSLIMPIRLHR